jgi:hypothetical protein
VPITDPTPRPLAPASVMTDDQLRRELADTHRIAAAIDPRRCLPGQRQVLSARLAELDSEYLYRYPHARDRWPWPKTHLLAL